MKKLLLLIPLLFTQQPAYLKYTTLPQQFTMTFQNYVENEKLGPSSRRINRFYYLQTDDGKLYMKSFFQQSALIPGAPLHFKDTPVWWYVMPDAERGGRYTARVYSEHWRQWALVAINLGPPQRDMVSNYYARLTIPPVLKPTTPVPVLNPPTIRVNWFYTAGHNGPNGPVLPATNQGYFAVYDRPANGHARPYALVGGGAGAHHQAYGELVYSDFNDKPNLTPKDFLPPVGFTEVRTEEKMCKPVENELLKSCRACHYTDPNPANPVQLYAPFEPGTQCAH